MAPRTLLECCDGGGAIYSWVGIHDYLLKSAQVIKRQGTRCWGVSKINQRRFNDIGDLLGDDIPKD